MKSQNKNPHLTKRKILLILGGVVTLVCIVILFITLTQPERSVANFCEVAKEEKDSFKANTNYDRLLSSFVRLDTVAPDEIRSDTSLIVKGYESVVSDPSKSVLSELGISSSQIRVNDFIVKNCTDY